MKRFGWIGIVVILAVAACTRHSDDLVETQFIASPTIVASPEMQSIRCSQLQAIDSLMWQQPDSALMCLIPYFDTCGDAKFCVSTTTKYNRHYAHLLLAELLYKNDYAQSNRTELMQAVSYFDSITSTLNDHPHASWRHGGLEPPSPERNDNLIFLDARAHYITGVGYYENDSMVSACAEYLKALETMESHFDDKGLVGHKARFMAYTYNRLGDMFSEQFMMESAISCYENALVYCRIEPTSPQGVSNILSRIGQQYDMKGEKEIARDYYGYAIDEMPSCDNLSYRNLVSIKALSDYRVGLGMEQPLIVLKQIISQADDMSEQFSRSVAIGDIFFEEKIYDSAMFYLEPVFFYAEDRLSQIQAAEHLMALYDSLGEREKSDQCMRFLAQQKKSEGQNKALVSQLEDLFEAYTDQKQQKEAEEAQKKSIRKTVGIIVPIAVAVALIILVLAKLRSKKLLKQQQEGAEKVLGETEQQHEEELRQRQAEAEKMLEDKEKHHQQEMEEKEAKARKELEERDKRHAEAIEAERQSHRMEQAAMSGRLKRSNQEIRELKGQIRQQDDWVTKTQPAASFTNEPICRLILERVNEGHFKSKVDYIIYKDAALDKQQLLDLRLAADRHFGQFTVRLKKTYPKLTDGDLDYCCLYLLGLTDADIAALMQRAYNTVIERNGKMRKILGNENPLPITLTGIAKDYLSV